MKTLSKKPALLLKPNIANAMIPNVIRSLTSSLLVTIFFYGFFGYLVLIDFLKVTFSFYITIVTILFFLTLVFPVFVFYMNLRNREYRFYNDRVEWYEGWMSISRHVLPYKKITDIVLHKTVWDRLFKTATIMLTSPGHIGSVYIPNINTPERIYEYLQKKILRLR